MLLALAMGVHVGKGIQCALKSSLISIHNSHKQGWPLPGDRVSMFYFFFPLFFIFFGVQYNRTFSRLNDFSQLIPSLWHVFLVNQFIKHRRTEEKKTMCPFLNFCLLRPQDALHTWFILSVPHSSKVAKEQVLLFLIFIDLH